MPTSGGNFALSLAATSSAATGSTTRITSACIRACTPASVLPAGTGLREKPASRSARIKVS
jgi:hypothetical protein